MKRNHPGSKARARRLLRVFSLCALLAVGMLVAVPAGAALVLDPTSYQETVQGHTDTNPARYGSGLNDYAPEAIGLEESGTYGAFRVNAWTSGLDLGSAYAHAEASGTGTYEYWSGSGSANGLIVYQFAVEEVVHSCASPPCAVVRVPVNIQGHGSVSVAASGGVPTPFEPVGYYAGASSDISLSVAGGSYVTLGHACVVSAHPAYCPDDSFSFSETFEVRVNWANAIELYVMAYAGTGNNDAGWGIGEAWVDPIIQIDPGFPLRANYRLVFSPGITAPGSTPPPGGTPVPEPSTVLLLGAGLAGLGLWGRKKARGSC